MNFSAAFNHFRRLAPYYLPGATKAAWPHTIFISVNSSCNLRCRMCDVGQKVEGTAFSKNLRCDSPSELELPVLRSLADDVRSFKPVIAVISTEPLLYKGLYEFASYCVRAGLQFHVTTNGLLLPKFYRDIVDSGVSSVTVSLDALGRVHDDIRGFKGSFASAVEGMRLLLDHAASRGSKLRLSLNCTITPDNYGGIYDYYRYFSKFPLAHISFSHLNYITKSMADAHNRIAPEHIRVSPSSVMDESALEKIDPAVLFEQSRMIAAAKGVPHYFTPRLSSAADVERYYRDPSFVAAKRKCMVPWFSSQIIASGEVIPLTRCFNVSFGNIREKRFTEIWNGEKMLAFRTLLRERRLFPACTRCCGVL